MRVTYTPAQRRETIAVMRRILNRFEHDDRALAAASHDALPDGYPTDSLPGPHTHGTTDRVPTTVRLRHNAHDPATIAYTLLHQAARLLEQADSRRAEALPPTTPTPTTDTHWCTSCLRSNHFTPRAPEKEVGRHSTLCGWCHAWQRTHDTLPPIALIDARARGQRITSRIIEETTTPQPRRRRRR